MQANPNIIIDCERMKYPHTGLYHFCESLGNALALNENINSELGFFLPQTKIGVFGNKVNYLAQQQFHKFILPRSINNSIWHATHQQTNYWPSRKAKAIVLTIHDLNFLHDGKSARSKATYLKQLQKKVDQSDAIVTVSKFTANEVSDHLQLGNKKPIVIYNGVSLHTNAGFQMPKGITDRPFIFSMGTIAKKKNVHVLPALLVGNDLQLVIAGILRDEVYKQEIISAAKKLGVIERIVFTGAITEAEKNWCYSNCLFFAFPSLAEGFGLPVLEAFYYGKPVLLSTHGSLPEIGSDYAVYINDFSPETMLGALEEVLNTNNEPQKIQSRKTYAAAFSWEKAAEDYIRIYKSFQ